MRRLSLALFLLLTQAACALFLVAPYDEVIDQRASRLQFQMDSALTALSEVPPTAAEGTYEATRPFYTGYGRDLRALELRVRSFPKNRETAAQITAILGSLEELRGFHEQQGRLSSGYTLRARELFNQSWQNVLALELAKKR